MNFNKNVRNGIRDKKVAGLIENSWPSFDDTDARGLNSEINKVRLKRYIVKIRKQIILLKSRFPNLIKEIIGAEAFIIINHSNYIFSH